MISNTLTSQEAAAAGAARADNAKERETSARREVLENISIKMQGGNESR